MNKVVYHGSPRGDIEALEPRISTHRKECIYATDNKVIAMMFMGRGNGDLDFVKSYDDGLPVLVERRPGLLEKIYNKSGFMYELPGDSFEHYDYLWAPEVISFEKHIVPNRVEYYENILLALKEFADNGLLKLYQYPERPEYVPFDNSDLVERYIKFEYRNGIKGAVDDLLKIYPEFTEQVKEKLKEMSDSVNDNVVNTSVKK